MTWIIAALVVLLVFAVLLTVAIRRRWLFFGELGPDKRDAPLLSTYKRERTGVDHPALISGRIGRRWWWVLMKPWWERARQRERRQTL